jgi:hypothetical protein
MVIYYSMYVCCATRDSTLLHCATGGLGLG